MTVSNTIFYETFDCSGKVDYQFNFPIQSEDEIAVYRLYDIIVDKKKRRTRIRLTRGKEYNIIPYIEGDFSKGGTIKVIVTPYVSPDQIFVIRDTDQTQLADLLGSGLLPPREVQRALDKLTEITQEIAYGVQEGNKRSISIPITDSGDINTELPDAATRAYKYVTFDNDGNVLVLGLKGFKWRNLYTKETQYNINDVFKDKVETDAIYIAIKDYVSIDLVTDLKNGNIEVFLMNRAADAKSIDGKPVNLLGMENEDIMQMIDGVLVPRAIEGGTVKSVNMVFPMLEADGNIAIDTDHIPEGDNNEYFTDKNLAESPSFIALAEEADANDADIAILKEEYHDMDEEVTKNTGDIATNLQHINNIDTELLKKVNSTEDQTTNHLVKWDEIANTITDGWNVGHDPNDIPDIGTSGKLPAKIIPAIPITDVKVWKFDRSVSDDMIWNFIVECWTSYGTETEPTGGEVAQILRASVEYPTWETSKAYKTGDIVYFYDLTTWKISEFYRCIEDVTSTLTPPADDTHWARYGENVKYLLHEIWSYTGVDPWTLKNNWVERKIDEAVVYSWDGLTGVIDKAHINTTVDDLDCIKGIHETLNLDTAQIALNKAKSEKNETNIGGNLAKININTADITAHEQLTAKMLLGTENFSHLLLASKKIDGVSHSGSATGNGTILSATGTNQIWTKAESAETKAKSNTTAIANCATKAEIKDFLKKGGVDAEIDLKIKAYQPIKTNTAKISYTDKAVVDSNTAALVPIKAAATRGFVLTRIGTGNNFGWQKPGGGLKVGDYRISSNSVKSCSPYEVPCNMGLLTLDVETYPELAEVYEVTEGTFKVALRAGHFVRNIGGEAGALNAPQDHALQNHWHGIGACKAGGNNNKEARFLRVKDHKVQDCSGAGMTRNGKFSTAALSDFPTGINQATETRPINESKNFFEILSTVYNYEAYEEHKDAELQMVYGWDEETKEYVYKTESPINFIESTKDKIVYWAERADLCTSIKPLEVKEGFAICIKDDKWEYKEDHRDEIVYLKVDGSPFTIEKIGKINNKYTTVVPPINVQYYKFTDKWELDADTKLALITTITELIKLHTEKAIKDELWELPVEDEGKFESEYEQFRYSSRDDAIAYITSLADKSMEELINLLK